MTPKQEIKLDQILATGTLYTMVCLFDVIIHQNLLANIVFGANPETCVNITFCLFCVIITIFLFVYLILDIIDLIKEF